MNWECILYPLMVVEKAVAALVFSRMPPQIHLYQKEGLDFIVHKDYFLGVIKND